MEGDKPDWCGPSPINYSTPCFSLFVCVRVSVRPSRCPGVHVSPSASRDITENMDPLYVLVPVPVRTDTLPLLVYETRARG